MKPSAVASEQSKFLFGRCVSTSIFASDGYRSVAKYRDFAVLDHSSTHLLGAESTTAFRGCHRSAAFLRRRLERPNKGRLKNLCKLVWCNSTVYFDLEKLLF